MNNLLNKWISLLLEDKEAVVATVVNGIGSRPRENGAQMLVTKVGDIYETIGGGKLEAEVIECAKQVFVDKITKLHHFSLTGKDFAQTDMICGGEGDVLIYYSHVDDLPVLNYLKELQVKDGWIFFPINIKNKISFIAHNATALGNEQDIPHFLRIDNNKDIFIEKINDFRYMVQWITTPGTLHIMGAGHISCEIAKIAQLARIECVTYDDRSKFVNKKRFPDAQCILVKDMSLPPKVEMNDKDMIVIVTRGHVYDKDNLEWALQTQAGYIGMIGSMKKTTATFNNLIKKGYQKKKIMQVHSPIGLDIGAQTPSEIAIAIVAQLIQFKRGKI